MKGSSELNVERLNQMNQISDFLLNIYECCICAKKGKKTTHLVPVSSMCNVWVQHPGATCSNKCNFEMAATLSVYEHSVIKYEFFIEHLFNWFIKTQLSKW